MKIKLPSTTYILLELAKLFDRRAEDGPKFNRSMLTKRQKAQIDADYKIRSETWDEAAQVVRHAIHSQPTEEI